MPTNDASVSWDDAREMVEKNRDAWNALAVAFAEDPQSMSVRNVALLYLGFAFTEHYAGSMEKFMAAGDGPATRDGLVRRLETRPVSLNTLFDLLQLCAREGDDALGRNVAHRIGALLKAIMATGSGRTPESPLRVLSVDDEYHLIRAVFAKARLVGQRLVGLCDEMTLQLPDAPQPVRLYFDVSMSMQAMMRLS